MRVWERERDRACAFVRKNVLKEAGGGGGGYCVCCCVLWDCQLLRKSLYDNLVLSFFLVLKHYLEYLLTQLIRPNPQWPLVMPMNTESSGRGVEVRSLQAVDQLLRQQRHAPHSIQLHPQPQDLLLHPVLVQDQALLLLHQAETQPLAEHQGREARVHFRL